MCIEHQQYWQCCSLVDSTIVDPCPSTQDGYRCNREQRIHPINGYCTDCRRSSNKLEDDLVTNPQLTRNDSYHSPWNPSKYKPIKSQPLKFPAYNYGPPVPERGRRSTRSPPSASVSPVEQQDLNLHYTDRQPEARSYFDDRHDRSRYQNRDTQYGQAQQIMVLRGPEASNLLIPPGYRVASPRTIKRLQKKGLLPPPDQFY